MINHKLVLENDFQEEFSLIAIHCSEEPYKMAYMINKQVPLKLARKKLDVDFSNNGLDIAFAIFEFEDDSILNPFEWPVNLSLAIVTLTIFPQLLKWSIISCFVHLYSTFFT